MMLIITSFFTGFIYDKHIRLSPAQGCDACSADDAGWHHQNCSINQRHVSQHDSWSLLLVTCIKSAWIRNKAELQGNNRLKYTCQSFLHTSCYESSLLLIYCIPAAKQTNNIYSYHVFQFEWRIMQLHGRHWVFQAMPSYNSEIRTDDHESFPLPQSIIFYQAERRTCY